MTNRQCIIDIENSTSSYILTERRFWISDNAKCQTVLPRTLRLNEDGTGVFTPGSANGVGGVITYNLMNINSKSQDKELAIYFYVPFDEAENFCAVAVYNKGDYVCDENLFNLMKKGEAPGFVRFAKGRKDLKLVTEEQGLAVCVSMSGKDIVHITVTVSN